MEAMISWTNVESFMLDLYLYMMGGSSELLAETYLELDGKSAKNRVILVAARKTLLAEHQKLFGAILSVYNSAQKRRDKLAHWGWGYSQQIPDGFLLRDTRDVSSPPDYSKILVYKERDLMR